MGISAAAALPDGLSFPQGENRRHTWEKVFPFRAKVKEQDYDRLARLEIPGGNILSIALNTAFLAGSEGVPIGMAHGMRTAQREYLKIGKLVTESKFGLYYQGGQA